MYLALLGFFLSLIAHMGAYIGIARPFGFDPWPLHIGMLLVCLPAVFAAKKLSKDFPKADMWKATLRGGPEWMMPLLRLIFGYALLNLFVYAVIDGNSQNEAIKLRGFSGHWLLFYYVSFAVLYSYNNIMQSDSA